MKYTQNTSLKQSENINPNTLFIFYAKTIMFSNEKYILYKQIFYKLTA